MTQKKLYKTLMLSLPYFVFNSPSKVPLVQPEKVTCQREVDLTTNERQMHCLVTPPPSLDGGFISKSLHVTTAHG